MRFDDIVISAIVIVAKNAMVAVGATPIAIAAVGIAEIASEIGALGVAATAAIVGAICRWIYFSLSLKDGMKGLIISPVIGAVLSDAKIPFLQTFIGELSPESVPIVNGFFIGMFGLLIVGFFLDFLKAYSERKTKGE